MQVILAFVLAARLAAPYPLVLMVVAEAQAADICPYLACAVVHTENEPWDVTAKNVHEWGTDHDLFQICDRWFPISRDHRENARTALTEIRRLLDTYPEREALARYRAGERWQEYMEYADAVLRLRARLRDG